MTWLFWISAFVLVYPYLIYPVLLVLWSRIKHLYSPQPDYSHRPSVTIILPVHNEAARIETKIDNLLNLDYPIDRFQILIIGDGCTDGTLDLVAKRGENRVVIHPLPGRTGKAAALNAGLSMATGDIVVFTDTAIMLDRSALMALVGHFSNQDIGCVSGEDYVGDGSCEGLYGRLELFLRREEARLYSIAGASGCFYGIRRSLCKAFPPGMAPDFLSVLDTVRAGYRAICEPRAHGTMTATVSHQAEFSRKARTFLRGMSALASHAILLNPFRWPQFAFILWSHKVARWLGPVALAGCLFAAIMLHNQPLYALLLFLQLTCYALAVTGIYSPGLSTRFPFLRISAFFLLVNAAAAKALVQWTAGIRQEIWEPTQRPSVKEN